ncbi:MAG: alpha/beta hydrolase [Microlunatus sp.]|uniref:alpha/beta fold hydrolase n=1 Tax=Intrasporangium sp. TaxID=1925024 RepID=UPI002647CEBA|nr:alpha/beta fold hydrolase [Intrasporangium sp.]MDN5763064.1 alpha/beta hydrolase [Microlunatus sp.]MDN5795419.1 alpha/beta hydrolase [Intrasporangium sp.]
MPKPRIEWFDCSVVTPRAQCGTVKLPLDYDRPRGAKTEVALLRVRAKDPKRRIGALFVNPGGPGASGVQFAAAAPDFLSTEMLARFDIVGIDPRGTNFSDNVACWRNFGAQAAALAGMAVPFPYTNPETRDYVASARKFGKACSTTGRPLSSHMSTAQVARDMDVLRRTLGDRTLTYLGFSYGTYLGQVYANLFPDRVRAIAIDGVLDPIGWAGTRDAGIPQTQRIKSGEGADKALREILRRCEAAGQDYCELAQYGEPLRLYDQIVASLKKQPLTVTDPDTGEIWYTMTYQDLIAILLSDLYSPDGSSWVDMDLTSVWTLLSEQSQPAAEKSAAKALRQRLEQAFPQPTPTKPSLRTAGARSGWGFPYDNSLETFQTVACTDSRNPRSAAAWRGHAALAEQAAPGFGPLWTWASAPCASSTWTVRDPDSYRGPFTRHTAEPVLVVGNYWDPATNYAGAVTAASLLPSSRLLSSDSWGHTAYGTSECVTGAVDRYLLRVTLPARGTRCYGDVQPFTEPLEGGPGLRRSTPARPLPPVVPPLPGSTPRQ